MHRSYFGGLVALAFIAGLGIEFVNNDRGADAVALREASSAQPQAHWSIVRRTFELWASDVSRGNFRTTGGSGPAWVLELTAPGDSRGSSYRAVVVVSAISGKMSAAGVGGNN